MSHPLNQQLADAVRSIGTSSGHQKAERFEMDEEEFSGRLDLSHMSLWSSDVEKIGRHLNRRYNPEAVHLISVNFNFNNLMCDDGVIALLDHLPGTIRELHLVSCGIGDYGGQAILDWLRVSAFKIKEVNMEQNEFSRSMKDEFALYEKENQQVMMIY